MQYRSENLEDDIGYSEKENIEAIANSILARLDNDKDFWIAVSGFEGEGKTTFSVKLAQAIEGENFSIPNNLIVDPDVRKVEEKILRSKTRAIILDEGIRLLYKRNFYSDENIYMNELAAVCRKEHKCVIINIPNLWDLDRGLLQHRIRLWAFIPQAGDVGVFMPDLDPFADDKWHRRENTRLLNKVRAKKSYADFSAADILTILQRSPNYVRRFSFTRMPSELEKEYLAAVEQFRKGMTFKSSKNKRAILHKSRIIKLIDFAIKQGFTAPALAEAIGVEQQTIYDYLTKGGDDTQL